MGSGEVCENGQTEARVQAYAEAEALKLKKQGNERYDAGDYEAAAELYSSGIKVLPSSVLHSNRAAAYIMLGWWQQALRDIKAALRKDPGNTKALERQARTYLALDRLDDALTIAGQLELAIPSAERLLSQKVSAVVRRLRWLAEHARGPTTVAACRTILAQYASRAERTSPLGIRLQKALCRALVERSDAIDNERGVLARSVRDSSFNDTSTEATDLTSFAQEAVDITGKLLEDCPEDAEVRYWRGRALARLGRRSDAEAQVLRVLQEEPEHAASLALLSTIKSLDGAKLKGDTHFVQGRLSEAIQCYTLGIDQDHACLDIRTVAILYCSRSDAYRRQGAFEKALEDINMSLVLQPRWCKALYCRGILLLENGRCAEALTELKVVQRTDPDFDIELETWLRRAHNWLSKPEGEANHYWLMQLPMDASRDDIRKQYRRLCLAWHPDKCGSTQSNRQKFEGLQVAYKLLNDDVQRERYDFGIWKDRPMMHHLKPRQKVRDLDDEINSQQITVSCDPRDRHLEEDDKVDSIFWPD
eukprot:CAMPEP_0172673788 /NCGR_PEP_ID=MMETSP1074-20121228/12368_1 /TAXON_ID=2916 /ORGANISM="Ceratium fusus, Strain PA161109" /LENGTH=532 /DNA_ID=CAMNT_0013491141 /DNA_START=53 /DNA_END=1648 /DNA_ORIENTATION=-